MFRSKKAVLKAIKTMPHKCRNVRPDPTLFKITLASQISLVLDRYVSIDIVAISGAILKHNT